MPKFPSPHIDTVGSFFLVVFEIFCFVNCGESLGIIFCTLFNHTGWSMNFTSIINSLFTCMAGYFRHRYSNSSVISSTIPGFLRGFNYISVLKWGTGDSLRNRSEDRRRHVGFLAKCHVLLHPFTALGKWDLSDYDG